MFKTWQDWHEFMKRRGATCTIDSRSFLLEGGCPHCKCTSWSITSDGWAYCKKCYYGQSQSFDLTERPGVYDISRTCPYGHR